MNKLLTLSIVQQGDKVLLGMKKRGFGAGRWNGFGGKVGPDETLGQAAERELEEEAGIRAQNIIERGVLEFEFEGDSDILEVHIFKVEKYYGEPEESEEMKPQWFDVKDIPYDSMWPDDRFWLPMFLEGKNFKGRFAFGKGDVIISQELIEISRDK